MPVVTWDDLFPESLIKKADRVLKDIVGDKAVTASESRCILSEIRKLKDNDLREILCFMLGAVLTVNNLSCLGKISVEESEAE